MTLKECYQAIGGDYNGVLNRLGSEALVQRFVLKFLEDGCCQDLHRALEAGDGEEAFRAVHTVKGVSQNLGFDQLAEAAYPLTDALRGGNLSVDKALVEEFDRVYHLTQESIRALADSL